MNYPMLNEIPTSREMVDVFKGYNHNLRIGDGEFFDMKNMTSDYYPVLSPRGARGVYTSPNSPTGLIAKDALCYVDGPEFVMNEYRVDMGLNDTPKQLISMGAYVIIMPDKKYINTKDLTDFGNIEAVYPGIEGQSVSASYEMCKIDGTVYPDKDIHKSPTAPKDPENMQLWIDQSATPHVLKQYSETNAVWVQIPTTYVKISAPNIAKNFNQYDAVKISGFPQVSSQLAELEGVTFPLWEACHDHGDKERAEGTNDYIVIVGILDEAGTYESNLRIERTMPKMDFITESGNRLFGCRYGPAVNGEIVNEIYASKLGDFKNWNCYMGLSTDSYAASVGTDGQFTGAITHMGYPLFFKENCVHKVYGNYPANFQIQTTACRGVQKDCEKSLAIVNETLLYKARSGVCAYDGSLPTEVSYAMGNEAYGEAVGGSHGNMSSFYGVSFSGVMREGVALWNNTAGAYDVTLKVLSYDRSKADLGGLLLDAIVEGNDRQADSLRDKFEDESECQSALRTAIKDRYKAGEIDQTTARKYLVKYGEIEEDDAYWKVEGWEYENETGEDFSKYNNFISAVETGKNLKFVIKEYTDNGVELDELASQITRHFKPIYSEMSASKRASIKGYLLNAFDQCGVDRETAETKIAKWQYEADHPELADKITYSQYTQWETNGKARGVSLDVFADVAEFRNGGGDTKSQEEVAGYINSLSISKAQKDALWCCFWKESTLNKAPWH